MLASRLHYAYNDPLNDKNLDLSLMSQMVDGAKSNNLRRNSIQSPSFLLLTIFNSFIYSAPHPPTRQNITKYREYVSRTVILDPRRYRHLEDNGTSYSWRHTRHPSLALSSIVQLLDIQTPTSRHLELELLSSRRTESSCLLVLLLAAV